MATVSPAAYWTCVALAGVACAATCTAARKSTRAWREIVLRALSVLLGADVVVYSVSLAVAGSWSARSDLPLALCNVAVVVAAIACWWRVPLLVELTYFWGLSGTIQAVVTPDLDVGFPHVVFFEYVVGHLGIVFAALFLVVGMRIAPRPRSVPRVLVITGSYTAFVGLVDAMTGANYMFLRQPPANATLLSVLGPWPWYVLSAAAVAIVLVLALDAPFWHLRRQARRLVPPDLSAPYHPPSR